MLPPALAPGEMRYTVSAAETDIRIFVYRGGRLASLGHNHLVAARNVRGTVLLRQPIAGSHVEVTIPVRSLAVDDPRQRQEAGADFGTELAPTAVQETRRNMLSERVLNADQFPNVELRALVAEGTASNLRMDVDLTIRGVTRRIQAPVRLATESAKLVASGELTIRQSDYGIEPFSVMGGALKVEDELTIRYRVVAQPLQ